MRRAMILATLLSVVAVGLWPPGLARAGNLSIGVQTDSVHLGIHIGGPPPLVVVPGTPVYAVERVPRPILGVPVDYYRNRPDHWKQHGPPPWAEAKGRDEDRGYEREKGRGGGKGHGKDKREKGDHN